MTQRHAARRVIRVLVVEDDPAMQALYRSIFRRNAGEFSALIEGSGEAALAALARERVDVVILDWDLPGIEGLSVLRAIRAGGLTRDLPVFMITGRLDLASEQVALDAGASDYGSKPVPVEDLLRRLVGWFVSENNMFSNENFGQPKSFFPRVPVANASGMEIAPRCFESRRSWRRTG